MEYILEQGDFVMVHEELTAGRIEQQTYAGQTQSLLGCLRDRVKFTGGNEDHRVRLQRSLTFLESIAEGSESAVEDIRIALPSLRKFVFDSRIVVGYDPRAFEAVNGGPVRRPSVNKIVNRLGKLGTVRASPRLLRPVYSKDFSHAILWTNAWDVAADVIYILRFKEKRWEVADVLVIGYV